MPTAELNQYLELIAKQIELTAKGKTPEQTSGLLEAAAIVRDSKVKV